MALIAKSKWSADPTAPKWLRIAPVLVLAVPFAFALSNAIRYTTGKYKDVYCGKCQNCSYEWEIGANHGPVASDTTQSH